MDEVNAEREKVLVSIVIPTKNEELDIGETLEACLRMEFDEKEIIVVDDSTDNTPAIVLRYAARGVRLVRRRHNRNACCGARSLGMRMSSGEIIVLINGDNRPEADFLRRIVPHYENGADYLIVRSRVMNHDNPWARYQKALEERYLSSANIHEIATWSEGFSCRREAARNVGFIPGDFPVPFCRDAAFGKVLEGAGYKKHVDLSIQMLHVAPSNVRDFLKVQIWRGTFAPCWFYYLRQVPMPHIVAREVLKLGWTLLRYALIVPPLVRAAVLSRSVGGIKCIGGILLADFFQHAGMRLGNWIGIVRIFRAPKDDSPTCDEFLEPVS